MQRGLRRRGLGTWAIWISKTAGQQFKFPRPEFNCQQNGGTLGMSQGQERPVNVTLSVQGSARARYIDADTGQITITGVYAQLEFLPLLLGASTLAFGQFGPQNLAQQKPGAAESGAQDRFPARRSRSQRWPATSGVVPRPRCAVELMPLMCAWRSPCATPASAASGASR